MANTKLKLKKSSVAGRVPVAGDLEYGELAINYRDGRLYYKDNTNAIKAFSDSDNTVIQITNLIDSDYIAVRTEVTSLVDSDYVNGLIDIVSTTDYVYQPTSSTTTFADSDVYNNVLTYTPGYIDVYLNGIRLSPTLDYVATSGTSIVLQGGAAVSGDTISISGRTRAALKHGFDDLIDSSATGDTTIDSFLINQYRSAKYIVQLSKNQLYQVSELLVIHNDSDVFMTEYGVVQTSASSLGTVSANLSGGRVFITVNPTSASTDVKMKRLRIDV